MGKSGSVQQFATLIFILFGVQNRNKLLFILIVAIVIIVTVVIAISLDEL